jgi:heme O synthase-like polyprenyltransferase
MMPNVGGSERTARVVVGFALLTIAFFHVVTGTLAIVAYILGTLALLTALFAFCPAWILFGINTSRSKQAHAKEAGVVH